MNSINKVFSELIELLGLTKTNVRSENNYLADAARWVLNDSQFTFHTYKPVPLRPVLESLHGRENYSFIPPHLLSTRVHLPTSEKPVVDTYYKEFQQALNNQINSGKNLPSFLELWASNLAFSEKYADLSLYEFLRLTVGIAECMEKSSGKLRLAGGSISGIQSYLYELVSKNAAKLLKGRSFYIQLLADSIMDELHNFYNLSGFSTVYSSGGGFYVLIPEADDTLQRFEQFAKDITEKLYKVHKTTLNIELAVSEPFDSTASVPRVWDEIFEKLGTRKFDRLRYNQSLLTDFLSPAELGGSRDKDPITNDELVAGEKTKTIYGEKVSQITAEQLELGKKLRLANYWVISRDMLPKQTPTLQDPFGKYHYLLDQIKQIGHFPCIIYALNKADNSETLVYFYGGNSYPVYEIDDPFEEDGYQKGDIIPFDVMVKNENFERLAILRMDVDNLGAIFSEKMSSTKYKVNWLRYTCVSKSLDIFFKGYLNILQAEVEQRLNASGKSVIIYSGGDDLFIVGQWDIVLTLADTIKMRFSQWSCNNLTLSGGIQMLPAKFPIMQAAKMSEAAEKKAKKHTSKTNNIQKNAVTFLEVPLNWDIEYPVVKELKENIVKLISQRELNRSYIKKINLHAEAQKHYLLKKGTKQAIAPKWKWQMAYDMSRYAKDIDPNKSTSNARQFVTEMAGFCFTDKYKGKDMNSVYSFLSLLQVAARWAELELRSTVN